MTGIELCQRIREMRSQAYVYCIVLTGHDQPIDRLSGIAEGIDDYIAKPFDPWELLMHVEAPNRVVGDGKCDNRRHSPRLGDPGTKATRSASDG